MPERPDTSAKVVDLAAYRAFRQELERRRRERIDGYPAPATINCRCSVRWIEPAGSTPDA